MNFAVIKLMLKLIIFPLHRGFKPITFNEKYRLIFVNIAGEGKLHAGCYCVALQLLKCSERF